jgi:hypothetical protein
MKIETKYNIGDEVWIISKGKVVKDVVDMIHIHIGSDENITYSLKSKRILGLFETIKESSIFHTKEELLKSL